MLPIILTLAGIAIWQIGGAGLIHAKAWLAPILIEQAWNKIRAGDPMSKPWPWADTWPIARLSVPSLGVSQFVLAGANGASLPFGPGHVAASAEPGRNGTITIAAHRDTHFSFLQALTDGSEIQLESADGRVQYFKVRKREIVDARRGGIIPSDTRNELLLVTCEPTGTFTYRGPYRLVVTASETAPGAPTPGVELSSS